MQWIHQFIQHCSLYIDICISKVSSGSGLNGHHTPSQGAKGKKWNDAPINPAATYESQKSRMAAFEEEEVPHQGEAETHQGQGCWYVIHEFQFDSYYTVVPRMQSQESRKPRWRILLENCRKYEDSQCNHAVMIFLFGPCAQGNKRLRVCSTFQFCSWQQLTPSD